MPDDWALGAAPPTPVAPRPAADWAAAPAPKPPAQPSTADWATEAPKTGGIARPGSPVAEATGVGDYLSKIPGRVADWWHAGAETDRTVEAEMADKSPRGMLDVARDPTSATAQQAQNFGLGLAGGSSAAKKLGEISATPKYVPEPEAAHPILEAPPGVETPKQAATRIDDGLYRLRKNATADKIEASDFLQTVPKEEMTPAFQERAHTEMEQRMVDPKAPLSPEVESFYDTTLKPFREEERANYETIKRRMGDDFEGELPGYEGYVHRVVKGRNKLYDAADPENFAEANPVTGERGGSRTLTTFSPSQMERKFWVLEGPDKTRTFLPKAPEGAALGQAVEGGVLKHATTAEIEKGTMRARIDPLSGEAVDEVPGVQYYKNPLVNTIDNVLSQRRVIRNLDLLDEMKQQLGSTGQAYLGKKAPEGFVETTLPQLKGWKFDPKIANTLNDFHGELLRGGALDQGLTKVNRFLTSTIFFNPVPHIINVATHWAPARGFDWLRAQGWKSVFVDGAKAIQEVATQGPLYQQMLREGAPLIYGDVSHANFHKLLLEKMFDEQMKDPQTWRGIAKNLGFHTVKDLVKAEYRASAKALWAGSDMFMMQRILELKRQGMSMREAIHEASRDIPSYRVPSEVMGSRMMAELMKNDRLLMFGRYKYGQFKAYSEMFKDMIGKGTDRFGNPLSESVKLQRQREAAGKLMVLALMGTVAYPLVDKALQAATGNENAGMKRSGPLSIPQAMWDLTTGQKDWVSTISSIVTPSPVVRGIAEATTGKDVFGRDIIAPKSTGLGQAVQAGEFGAGQLGPGQALERGIKQGPLAMIADMFGAKIPTDEQVAGKFKGQKIERGQARSREKHDEIENAVKRVLGQ